MGTQRERVEVVKRIVVVVARERRESERERERIEVVKRIVVVVGVLLW